MHRRTKESWILPVAIATSLTLCAITSAQRGNRPLSGPAMPVPGITSARNLDIAYDATHDVYLVVGEDTGVVGQLLRPDGTPVGGGLQIASTGGNPAVADIGGRGVFVVAYEIYTGSYGAYSMWGRVVDAASGSVGPAVPLSPAKPARYSHQRADVGGSRDGDQVVIVWEADTGGEIISDIWGCSGNVDAAGALQVGPGHQVLVGNGIDHPRLSFDDGGVGRWLLVYSEPFGSDIRAEVRQSDLSMLAGLTIRNANQPTADGDGTTWMLGYETRKPQNDPDLDCVRLDFDATSNTLRQSVTRKFEGDPGAYEHGAEVAMLNGSCLIGYTDSGGSEDGLYTWSLDPADCRSCEGQWLLTSPAPAFFSGAEVLHWAPRRTPTDLGPEAIAVWTDGGTAMMRTFVGNDGVTTDLGGGCGQGGTAIADCALRGNVGFLNRLVGASAMRTSAFVLGGSQSPISCGACTLIPAVAIVLPAMTDGLGTAQVPTPIPNSSSLYGASLYEQWIVVGGQACTLGVDLSSALQVQIE